MGWGGLPPYQTQPNSEYREYYLGDTRRVLTSVVERETTLTYS